LIHQQAQFAAWIARTGFAPRRLESADGFIPHRVLRCRRIEQNLSIRRVARELIQRRKLVDNRNHKSPLCALWLVSAWSTPGFVAPVAVLGCVVHLPEVAARNPLVNRWQRRCSIFRSCCAVDELLVFVAVSDIVA